MFKTNLVIFFFILSISTAPAVGCCIALLARVYSMNIHNKLCKILTAHGTMICRCVQMWILCNLLVGY